MFLLLIFVGTCCLGDRHPASASASVNRMNQNRQRHRKLKVQTNYTAFTKIYLRGSSQVKEQHAVRWFSSHLSVSLPEANAIKGWTKRSTPVVMSPSSLYFL